jgi:hypothetical protein
VNAAVIAGFPAVPPRQAKRRDDPQQAGKDDGAQAPFSFLSQRFLSPRLFVVAAQR